MPHQEDVTTSVLKVPSIAKHLARSPEDEKKILAFIKEIDGGYDKKWVAKAAVLLEKTLLKLYDSVELYKNNKIKLKELQKDYHIVLVPNHQSHADYVALQYLMYKEEGVPVRVAGGINMNIFPVGILFKKCGAFFLRRRFVDPLYKKVFQAYVYYLFNRGDIIEFFFEGGRTRTGKLRPPRFGLFSMILDAFDQTKDSKPLMFLPISIAHEVIPEEQAHTQELYGKDKKKESARQLFNIRKLFGKKLGTVHVKINDGIVVKEVPELKKLTNELAFECFRSVSAGMMITPTSLLAMILLDDYSGTLTWAQIEKKAQEILSFCVDFDLPLTNSLKGERFTTSLKKAMDLYINNSKVKILNRAKLGKIFYLVPEEARVGLSYQKNMIIHHFLVPSIINGTWLNVFGGNITSTYALYKYLLQSRRDLRYDFYLPSTRDMLADAKRVIEAAVGHEISHINEILSFPTAKLYEVASYLSPFSTALTSAYEGVYLAARSLNYLTGGSFTEKDFLRIAKEVYSLELEHGKTVRYPESFTIPAMKLALVFFERSQVIQRDGESFSIIDHRRVEKTIEHFSTVITNQVNLNIKFS